MHLYITSFCLFGGTSVLLIKRWCLFLWPFQTSLVLNTIFHFCMSGSMCPCILGALPGACTPCVLLFLCPDLCQLLGSWMVYSDATSAHFWVIVCILCLACVLSVSQSGVSGISSSSCMMQCSCGSSGSMGNLIIFWVCLFVCQWWLHQVSRPVFGLGLVMIKTKVCSGTSTKWKIKANRMGKIKNDVIWGLVNKVHIISKAYKVK